MHPISRLRLPIYIPAGIHETKRNCIQERYAEFQLMRIDHGKNVCEGGRLFYECSAKGCTGAGGASWDSRLPDIPQEVIDALEVHIGLCRGIVR